MTELRTLTAEEREELEVALEYMQSTQTAFWDAMGTLEALLDWNIELDGNTDYESYDVESLLQMELETQLHRKHNNEEG